MNYKYKSLWIICMLFISVLGEAKKIKWEELKGLRDSTVTITSSGKSRKYYQIDAKTPLIIQIEGPTRLKIRTRLELSGQGKTDYKLTVIEDAKREKEFSLTTGPSDSTKLDTKILGKIEDIYIDVSNGSHGYKLQLASPATGTAYARIYKEASSSQYTKFAPISYGGIEILLVNEREISYYRATEKKEVTIEVFGPTQLEVISRLEFTPEMKGEQTYGIEITTGLHNKGKRQENSFKTNKSASTTYKSKSTGMVGQDNKLILEVPDGKHIYKFKPKGVNSVLIKFLIPKKDIKQGG